MNKENNTADRMITVELYSAIWQGIRFSGEDFLRAVDQAVINDSPGKRWQITPTRMFADTANHYFVKPKHSEEWYKKSTAEVLPFPDNLTCHVLSDSCKFKISEEQLNNEFVHNTWRFVNFEGIGTALCKCWHNGELKAVTVGENTFWYYDTCYNKSLLVYRFI